MNRQLIDSNVNSGRVYMNFKLGKVVNVAPKRNVFLKPEQTKSSGNSLLFTTKNGTLVGKKQQTSHVFKHVNLGVNYPPNPSSSRPLPHKPSPKRISPEIMNLIWSSNDFKFEQSKFKLVKNINVPGMPVCNMKRLLKEKANIPFRNIGGLRFFKSLDCETCLINEKVISKNRLLESNKFACWTLDEVLNAKKDFLALNALNNDYVRANNRPLSIALKLLFAGLSGANNEKISNVLYDNNLVSAFPKVVVRVPATTTYSL